LSYNTQIQNMINDFLLSLKATKFAFLVPFIAFLFPVVPIIMTVGLFIVFDTLTGVAKVVKKHGWANFSSKGLSSIVSKLVLYSSCIILTYVLESMILFSFVKHFVEMPLFITKIVAILLCYIEIKSVSENFQAITGVSLWGTFKDLLSRIKTTKNDMKL